MKQYFYLHAILFTFFCHFHLSFSMQPEGYHYNLDIAHLEGDQLKIEISKKPRHAHEALQTGSLIANFATHTCDKQDLFEPFNIASSAKIVFGDRANPDCFLWSIPNFGLLKMHQDGTTFFGHGANDAPLMHDNLTIKTPGDLFLEMVKVADLEIKSPKTQICEVAIADRVIARDIHNKSCLQAKQVLGSGKFINEGRLELIGSPEYPAILGIKEFHNKSNRMQALLQSSYMRITSGNQTFKNSNHASIEVSDTLCIDAAGEASFLNKGYIQAHILNLHRPATNTGILQVHDMKTFQPLINEQLAEINSANKIAVSSALENNGEIRAKSFDSSGTQPVNNNGLIRTDYAKLSQTPLNNLHDGDVEIRTGADVCSLTITNDGRIDIQGNINLSGTAQIDNKKMMRWQQANLVCATNIPLNNYGKWLMDRIICTDLLNVTNTDVLHLTNSSLKFAHLKNDNDLVLNSGVYEIDTIHNKRMQLFNPHWLIDSADKSPNHANKLIFKKEISGEIECQGNLHYCLSQLPNILRVEGNLYCWEWLTLSQLKAIIASKLVHIQKCNHIISEQSYDFPHIAHLDLAIHQPFTAPMRLTAPALSLTILGSLNVGKDNQHLGVIAATEGPLTILAHCIDGRYGKFYGKGATELQATAGDINLGAIGAAANGYIYGLNGSYIATDSNLTLKAKNAIKILFGQTISNGNQLLTAGTKVSNIAGTLTSHQDLTVEAPELDNKRNDPYNRPVASTSQWYSGCYQVNESSDGAVIRASKNINLHVNKGTNLASAILAGKDILYGPYDNLREASKICPPTFTSIGRTNYGYGYHHRQGLHQGCLVQQVSSTILAGQKIEINAGDVVIKAAMNSPFISIAANTAFMGNDSWSRPTVTTTQPILVNLTEHLQQQAQQPGILRLADNGAVQTEFPLGTPFAPNDQDRIVLGNAPLQWRNIFNPLSGIDITMHVQQLLANLAGKTYAGKAKGRELTKILFANAGRWRQQHGTEAMSQEQMHTIRRSMLLAQIVNGLTLQQQTLLCIAPNDINPYQSEGDIVADSYTCITEGNQTYSSSRVVAQGPEGITLQSNAGSITMETQSHTIVRDEDGVKTIQQIANPQQQLIAQNGPVNIITQGDITRIGNLIAAHDDVNLYSEAGSIREEPLVMQTIVQTTHKSGGLFSSSTNTETQITHQVVPCSTISGATLHDCAGVSIHKVATQDCAQEEIILQAPTIDVQGLIVADRTIKQSENSGPFSEQSHYESKETPYMVPATMQAPLIQLVGHDARINAHIKAQELWDHTEHGAQFVAKVAQMLCSGQTLASSPLMNVDVGYNAMHEVMIPPMLMVERIIRAREDGHMLFESAILDKNRTEVIGKFVETTYQLKQWHTSWNHTSQVIPNEALVIVAFAIAMATQGAGVGCLGSLLESVTAATGMQLSAAGIAAVNAGFSTICSTAATSLLRTGDPLQTLRQLTSSDYLKSVAFNMASAGLCSQLGGMLGVNMKPELKAFASHVQEHALRSTVDALLDIAINDTPVEKALEHAGTQIPLKAVAAYVANKICTNYTNVISRKIAHGALGGLSGYAQDHHTQGFVSGATGAIAADTIGDLLITDAQQIAAIAHERLKCAGKPLTPENVQKAIAEEMRFKMNLTKIAASSLVALAKQNPAIALAAATNVLENDIAIRGSLYALLEFQQMVSATGQAFIMLNAYDELQPEDLDGVSQEEDNGWRLLPNSQNQLDESDGNDGSQEQQIALDAFDQTERKPFVKNPKAGIWFRGCISGSLILHKGRERHAALFQRLLHHKDPKCPFAVTGHGNSSHMRVDTQDLHESGLDKIDTEVLKNGESVSVNAHELAQLIRTAPGYKEGQHIHLDSCNCGATQRGIAQQLADIMEVPVSAHTGMAAGWGPLMVSLSFDNDSWIPKLEEIKTFYPHQRDPVERWYGEKWYTTDGD